jgi:hypothetical protein
MAITSLLSPSIPVSSKTPIIFRVTSNSTDITTQIQLKVRYRRNQDEFYKLAATQIQSKVPFTNYFEFNIASVCDKLLTSDYKEGSIEVGTNAENSAINVIVDFTEYYPSSAFVAVDTLKIEGFIVQNTDLYFTETQSIAIGSQWYLSGASTTNKFLTDSPASQYLRANERIQLDFLTANTAHRIRIREYKINGSTSTASINMATSSYSEYLWNWQVNQNEVVTIVPRNTTNEGLITTIGAGGTYKYISDDNVMWGSILQIKDETVDIVLPITPVLASTIDIRMRSATGTASYDIYYFYGGIWNSSGLATGSLTTAFSTFNQALPATATSVRIRVFTQNVYIAWAKVNYTDNKIIFKRGQFTLGTSYINTDTKKLEIWLERTSPSTEQISETKTFVIDNTPTVQDTTRFAVKNKRGGFDHFTYTEGHSEILTAEKTRSRRELPNTFTTKDRGLTVDKVVSEKIFTCYSRYIEEAELQWWATIIESDEVYVIVNDVRYAVDIVTDSVISYTHTDLVQLKIDWTYAVTR